MKESGMKEGLTSATALADQSFAGYRTVAQQGEEAKARG